MARTTLDIDTPLLKDLKKIQEKEGKSLGRVVSDLLTQALALHRGKERRTAPFRWTSQEMGARVDLNDKEAVAALLDEDRG